MEARSCSRPPTEGPPGRSAQRRCHVGRAQPTRRRLAQRPALPRPPDVSGKRRRRHPLPEPAGAAPRRDGSGRSEGARRQQLEPRALRFRAGGRQQRGARRQRPPPGSRLLSSFRPPSRSRSSGVFFERLSNCKRSLFGKDIKDGNRCVTAGGGEACPRYFY